ncbi:MAG: amidohydrolase [Pseudomonadota bacterium]
MIDRSKFLKTISLLVACAWLQGCSINLDYEFGDNSRQNVDLIATGDYLVSMAKGDNVIEDGAIAVRDGSIVATGTRAHIEKHYVADETLSGEGRILMPGLINGHSHAAMTLLRGVADDLPLQQWLEEYIFPAEVRFVDAEFVRVGTELACWEMIRGGTTTFVDMYYFPDQVAAVVERCGMRAIVVPSVIDQVAPDATNAEQSLAQAIDFAKRWKNRHPRIYPSIGGHAIYTLSPATLKKLRAAALEHEVPVGIHLAESPWEVSFAQQSYQQTPVQYLASLGFFDNKVIGAHVIYVNAEDQKILAGHGVGAIHNPSSNMKISSGIAPVAEMLNAGIQVGLGTDGAASNNDLDMWEEIRLASFLQKVDLMEPEAIPALTALELATRRGAEAIGLEGQIGTLKVGQRADFIQVAIDELTARPLYDPISHLAYVADEHDVVNVVIDGQIVMRDKEILTIDEAALREKVAKFEELIRQSLNEK